MKKIQALFALIGTFVVKGESVIAFEIIQGKNISVAVKPISLFLMLMSKLQNLA